MAAIAEQFKIEVKPADNSRDACSKGVLPSVDHLVFDVSKIKTFTGLIAKVVDEP